MQAFDALDHSKDSMSFDLMLLVSIILCTSLMVVGRMCNIIFIYVAFHGALLGSLCYCYFQQYEADSAFSHDWYHNKLHSIILHHDVF